MFYGIGALVSHDDVSSATTTATSQASYPVLDASEGSRITLCLKTDRDADVFYRLSLARDAIGDRTRVLHDGENSPETIPWLTSLR